MRARSILSLLATLILLFAVPRAAAGTWSDDFSENALGSDWTGDTNFFSIVDGALKGLSASPLAPVPLHKISVGANWTDYVAQCRINVVTPNMLVCSKGALILRHSGNDGYVFALHVAAKRIEVYRLSNGEMLLSHDAPLELQKWYRVRAQAQDDTLTFYVDDQRIGTITDRQCPSGAVSLAVQDTLETLFDNFTVSGPNIPSNGLEAAVAGQTLTLSWPSAITNRALESAAALAPAPNWMAVANSPSTNGAYSSVTVQMARQNRFFRLAPVGR